MAAVNNTNRRKRDEQEHGNRRGHQNHQDVSFEPSPAVLAEVPEGQEEDERPKTCRDCGMTFEDNKQFATHVTKVSAHWQWLCQF